MLKKNAKKLLALLIVVAMAAMLVGCKNEAQDLGVSLVQTPEPTAANPSSSPSGTAAGEGAVNLNADNQNTEQDILRRDFYTKRRGGGQDVFTLMIYMCGSDLETYGGHATDDLFEIFDGLDGASSGNLNIVVETGGAKQWWNDTVSNTSNQRWLSYDDGLELLEDVGLRDMTDPGTLSDFIRFSADNFPADRYGLILWDHGGGTNGGYAYDEHFPDSQPMTIGEINSALYAAGVKFDFIGFDACLMATAETAFMLDQHADYMIASQRVEPGEGWYYTDFISALKDDTSIDTLELLCIIADSFIRESSDGFYGNQLTLSVIDLSYIGDLFNNLYDYFSSAENALINDAAFSDVSRARYDSRELANNYDQVDLLYLVSNMDVVESRALLESLDRCVAYNAATIANHSGLALYFPYEDLSGVESVLEIHDEIGIDESYRSFISTFATIMVGGQKYSGGGSGSPFGNDFDTGFWQEQDWVDNDLIYDYVSFYSEYSYSGELEIYEKGDYFALSLSDEDWDLITAITLLVYLDAGDGQILLGRDNIYTFDEDGDLIVEFDNTWVALDGQIVSFYAMEDIVVDGFWYTWGYVPVLLNGMRAELVLVWDDDNPYGYVAGARYVYGSNVSGRGLFELRDGDQIWFMLYLYSYDEEYIGQFFWNRELTVNGELEVSYEDVGDGDCLVYYRLYDIYGNIYWTEPLIYSHNW